MVCPVTAPPGLALDAPASVFPPLLPQAESPTAMAAANEIDTIFFNFMSPSQIWFGSCVKLEIGLLYRVNRIILHILFTT
ncbi:hypothetical protein D3C76_1640820 [compost metagenome]